MHTYTPDEVQKLDRVVLESHFHRLQALNSAQKNRLTEIRQRLCLIELHVSNLKKHLTAAIGDGK